MSEHDKESSQQHAHPVREVLHGVALELGLSRPRAGEFGRRDERIREDICERLIEEQELDVTEVSVAVQDGIVRLDGTVPVRGMKHRIEDLSAACPGVRDVENRIRVERAQRGT